MVVQTQRDMQGHLYGICENYSLILSHLHNSLLNYVVRFKKPLIFVSSNPLTTPFPPHTMKNRTLYTGLLGLYVSFGLLVIGCPIEAVAIMGLSTFTIYVPLWPSIKADWFPVAAKATAIVAVAVICVACSPSQPTVTALSPTEVARRADAANWAKIKRIDYLISLADSGHALTELQRAELVAFTSSN